MDIATNVPLPRHPATTHNSLIIRKKINDTDKKMKNPPVKSIIYDVTVKYDNFIYAYPYK